jgi:hypothetical protein
MQYSPKLKIAAEEIKQILEKHDIAGVIVLHTPGYGEHILHLMPSYSCVKHDPLGLRVRAMAADFNGDTAKRDQVITDTANMMSLFSEIVGRMWMQLDQMSQVLDKATGAEHYDKGSSSHTEQNN